MQVIFPGSLCEVRSKHNRYDTNRDSTHLIHVHIYFIVSLAEMINFNSDLRNTNQSSVYDVSGKNPTVGNDLSKIILNS